MCIRSESDAKYLVEKLNGAFKRATKYSYPDPGELMELGNLMSKVESALLEIPALKAKVHELELELVKEKMEAEKK